MTRGLPYSLAFHSIALVMVFLFGSTVSRNPVEMPKSIRVKMVHLPRTKPAPEQSVAETITQPVEVKETVPDLPPKEIPKPKPEIKKPIEKKVEPVENKIDANPQADVSPIALGPSVEGTDSDFPFAWYLARIEGLIARNWNPRQLGFGKKALVSCAVHFQVAKGGSVSQVTLVRNSGIGVFDRESLRAVQTTNLPPLPPQFSGSSLGVTFIFNLEPGS